MKLHKETQKYDRFEAYFLLAFFILSGIALLIKLAFYTPDLSFTVLVMDLAVILISSGILYLLLNLRFDLSIGKSSIKYKYKISPFFTEKAKIKWKDVQEVKVVEGSPEASYSGHGVHFSTMDRRICLNGNSGLSLYLKNGKHIFLGCKNIDGVRNALSRLEENTDLQSQVIA